MWSRVGGPGGNVRRYRHYAPGRMSEKTMVTSGERAENSVTSGERAETLGHPCITGRNVKRFPATLDKQFGSFFPSKQALNSVTQQ